MAYDVFISYRRETGADDARLLQQALKARGYNVFFDYDSLRDGKFDEEILEAIDEAPVFVLMLTERALDRCVNEGDWVRLEIERALSSGKKIVSVAPSDQKWNFPENLPDSLRTVKTEQASELNKASLFEVSIDKMIEERFPDVMRRKRKPSTESLKKQPEGSFVVCPICGKKNRMEGTFRCRECGRDNLCLRHQDEKTYLCAECAAKKAREREKAESLLREGIRLEWADPPKAVACFREAATLGNREAWHHYGDMLFTGRGIKKDVDAAFDCYRKCDDSDAWIQYDLGLCHLHFAQERGDSKEGVEAVAWLRKSAERGVPWACVKMGDCHRDGIGVPQDDAEAMKWYRHALKEEGRTTYADVGAFQWAEFCIGCLFRDGKGVGKVPAEALQWFHKAALRGSDAADPALTAAAEVLAEREGDKLDWRQFRIIHGVRIRDASGQWVPLAGLVASNRGIFVGVFLDSLPLNIRNCLPNDNPAWPFAQSVSKHCGIPEGCFGAALVVPEMLRVSGVDFPFWAVQESHLTDVMLNASVVEPPDWLGNRQDIIRKLETLPMSPEGAEKNALIHFKADVPEWEDGVALLEKVEKPSHQLVTLARQAAEELDRLGKRSVAGNVRGWLEKKGYGAKSFLTR